MSLLCEVTDFRGALLQCAKLLREEELEARGLQETPSAIPLCREFLHYLSNQEVTSYKQLVELLQGSRADKKFLRLTGFLGKLLDAVQILKPNSARNQRVRQSIYTALGRTGHDFIWNTLPKDTKEHYEHELLKATAIYQLLEIAALMEPSDSDRSRNPISTLRNSMGARLAEEYFSELLAGWVVEDTFKSFLETKGFKCALEGPDRERQIQFARPTEMGIYDFRVSRVGNTFSLELQRVGKLSRVGNTDRIKTYLRSHKYEGGDDDTKVLVLWIGKPAQQAYKKWTQKLVFISNVRSKSNISFSDDKLLLPTEILDSARTWKDLADLTGEEIIGVLGAHSSELA